PVDVIPNLYVLDVRRASTIRHQLLEAAFPLVCPGCGRPGGAVCPSCATRLRAAPAAAPPVGIDAWGAVYTYEGVARELVARVKYRGARGVVPWLAQGLANTASVLLADEPGATVVTWAPTTPARRRARGFDHAELLARALGRELHLPVRPLLRRRDGPA